MDSRASTFVQVERKGVSPSIAAVLASAVLEWFLIFLLFLDACFSYFVTKLARFGKLRIPCLMCSRLDHVLGKEKDGFYWDLICNDHKLKLSSIVLCKNHNKLVDAHEICEDCLFSFATVNKSNAETYRLLVGKLGDEPHHRLDHDPLLSDHRLSKSDGRKCSCCYEQWISRGHTTMLLQTRSIGYELADFRSPLLATKRHDRNGLDEIRDVSCQEIRTCKTEERSIDPLPHVEYEKVRMTSDTESEALFSDDDCPTVSCVTVQGKENLISDYQEKDLPVDDLASEKLMDPTAISVPSVRKSELQDAASDLLSAPIGHSLEELNQEHVTHKIDSASSDLISFNDVVPSSNAMQSVVDDSKDKLNVVGDADSGKAVKTCSEMTESLINPIQTNGKQSDLNSSTGSDSGPQMPSTLELGDAYTLAIGSRGRQLSGKFLEQRSFKDSSRISEDLKLLLSQLSANRGVEPLYDISPRISGNIDEFRTSEASNSFGLQMLQKRMSLERNELGISLDGSIVSEVEGESEVDRLRRQVEHDRKLMSALYKELEEERNASAVAANQAMAMITRLQEEKAALQLEACQFIRLMEEQVEYDGEDLQKANDLLADKEREIQDLEMELEAYRKNIGGISIVEENFELNSVETGTKQTYRSYVQPNMSICSSDGNMLDTCSETDEAAKFKDEGTNIESSLLECKNQSSSIRHALRKLEKKLNLFSSNDASSFRSNDENLLAEETLKTGVCEWQNSSNSSLRDGEKEDHLFEHSALHEGSHSAQGESASQCEGNLQLCPGSGELKHGNLTRWDTESDAFRKEFLMLSGRLAALEAECSFLEKSINSISNGDDGLKLVQDIASQLRELHAITLKAETNLFTWSS